MEATFKQDTSYFSIDSPDLIGLIANITDPIKKKKAQKVTKLIEDDVLSLSITEELGKITSGSLTVRDNDQIYSKILRNGVRFNLEWGYKKWFKNLVKLKANNKNELVGNGNRKGLQCIIQKPGGGGDNQGQTTYTMTFFGNEILNDKVYNVYN